MGHDTTGHLLELQAGEAVANIFKNPQELRANPPPTALPAVKVRIVKFLILSSWGGKSVYGLHCPLLVAGITARAAASSLLEIAGAPPRAKFPASPACFHTMTHR